jgi:hypothetical protein
VIKGMKEQQDKEKVKKNSRGCQNIRNQRQLQKSIN